MSTERERIINRSLKKITQLGPSHLPPSLLSNPRCTTEHTTLLTAYSLQSTATTTRNRIHLLRRMTWNQNPIPALSPLAALVGRIRQLSCSACRALSVVVGLRAIDGVHLQLDSELRGQFDYHDSFDAASCMRRYYLLHQHYITQMLNRSLSYSTPNASFQSSIDPLRLDPCSQA